MTLLKLLAGILLITIAAYVVLGEQLAGTSANAVINSQVTGVQAPIAGRLALTGVTIGARIRKGGALGQVNDTLSDNIRLNDLVVDLAVAQAETARQAFVLTRVRGLIGDLNERARRYREARLDKLRREHAASAALVRAAEAELTYARQTLSRHEALSERGIAPTALRDEARYRAEAAARRLDSAREQAAAAEVTLHAATTGIFIGDGYNDQPYSEQRVSELQVRESEAQTALDTAQTQVAALQRRVDAERLRVNRLSTAALSAHVNAVVWTIGATDGEVIQRGQTVLQLVNCDAAIVTASVSESVYNRLRTGQVAHFRPSGRTDIYDATIVRLAGAGAASIYRDLAVAPSQKHLERYDVALSVPGLATSSDLHCSVGNTGRVFFERRPLDWLRDLLG